MSEAPPDICDDVDALLSEVAALDMALLRHVNRVALATEDPDTLNGLVRSQQRLARSIRTTLTTKARLAKERAEAARPAKPLPPFPWEVRDAEIEAENRPRIAVQEAALEALRLEYDPAEVEAIDYELDVLLDEVWEPDNYDRLLPAERTARFLHHIRKTFGPSRTVLAASPPEPAARPTDDVSERPPWIPPSAARDPGGGD